MALSKIRDFDPATDGTFIAPISLLEQIGAVRALITSDDGTCQGYAHTDGRIWCGPLITRNAAKIAADAAVAASAATDLTKVGVALATVANQVTRAKAVPLPSRTDQDKWLLALTFLLFRQE